MAAGDRISPLIKFTGERSGRGGRVLLSNTLPGSVSSIIRWIPFRKSIVKEVILLLVCLRHARNEICTCMDGWMGLRLRRRVHYIYSVGIVCYYQSREAWHSGWWDDGGLVLPNIRHFSQARYITCKRDMMDVGVACSLSLHPESGDLSTMV